MLHEGKVLPQVVAHDLGVVWQRAAPARIDLKHLGDGIGRRQLSNRPIDGAVDA